MFKIRIKISWRDITKNDFIFSYLFFLSIFDCRSYFYRIEFDGRGTNENERGLFVKENVVSPLRFVISSRANLEKKRKRENRWLKKKKNKKRRKLRRNTFRIRRIFWALSSLRNYLALAERAKMFLLRLDNPFELV